MLLIDSTIKTYQVDGYEVLLSDDIQQLESMWTELALKDTFLSLSYLSAMIETLPDDMEIQFLVVRQNNKTVALNIFQSKVFIPADSLNASNGRNGYYCALGRYLRRMIQGAVKVKLMVWGNLYLTGQHGYILDESVLDHDSYRSWMMNAIQHIHQKDKGLDYDVLMIKDIDGKIKDAELLGLLPLRMEPNMDLHMRPHWNSFEDYLSDMSSKYRTRVKRARKKGKNLERRILSLEEIKKYTPDIFKLYENITEKVSFNAVALKPEYFYQLASTHPEYRIAGYFLEGNMVGFGSFLPAEDRLEAYYVGLDHSINQQTQLYLNILLDFVDEAIKMDVRELCMSRTAMEIKSSVGATASELSCYLHHKRSWGRAIMPYLVRRMNPTDDWVPRHPFKDGI